MRKIPSLFERDWTGDKRIVDKVTPGTEWVTHGEGVATRKWDGAAVMFNHRLLYKRYDAKPGRIPPASFQPCSDLDPVTGHQPGWVLVGGGPEDRWFREALQNSGGSVEGTFEACGPHFNGNPEGFDTDRLIPHGMDEVFPTPPTTFEGLREFLKVAGIEGIVWWHPDGRMVKIKAKDFGLNR